MNLLIFKTFVQKKTELKVKNMCIEEQRKK